jgi:hypothetical protein
VLCLVAKSDMRHVEQALKTTPEENLAMIRDSVRTGRDHGRQVFIDCEHFFDGFRHDPEYASLVVRTALEAGAEAVVLCDTNGGRIDARGALDGYGAHGQQRRVCGEHNEQYQAQRSRRPQQRSLAPLSRSLGEATRLRALIAASSTFRLVQASIRLGRLPGRGVGFAREPPRLALPRCGIVLLVELIVS